MRAVPPVRCPKCGFESSTVSDCTFCGSPLRDAEGRLVPPTYARERGKVERQFAGAAGVGASGLAMIAASIIAHGPILAPIGVGIVTGLIVRRLLRGRMRDEVTHGVREALSAAKKRGGTKPGARVVLTGRVHVLRSVSSPAGTPVAAYRRRDVEARVSTHARSFFAVSRKDSLVQDVRERHVGGRFAIVGADGVGVVDEDWLFVAVAGEAPDFVAGSELVTVEDDDEVTVVGPAARGRAEDAARFVTGGSYREAGDALIFDGRSGVPVVVIVTPRVAS